MNETQNYLRYLSQLSTSERNLQIESLREGLKTMQRIESIARVVTFKYGDRVWFESKNGTLYLGTIQKLKTKNAEVLVTHWKTGTTLWTAMSSATLYNVSGSLLNPANEVTLDG